MQSRVKTECSNHSKDACAPVRAFFPHSMESLAIASSFPDNKIILSLLQICATPQKSQNLSEFPDFELRSPERSQKSGISRFLTRKIRNVQELLKNGPITRVKAHVCALPLLEYMVLLTKHCSGKRRGS